MQFYISARGCLQFLTSLMTLLVFNITGETPWEKRIRKKKESNRKMTANREEWKRKEG